MLGENCRLYSFVFNPGYRQGQKKIKVNLIGYDIDSPKYKDYGSLRIEDGRRVIYSNTLGATGDGRLVPLAWIELLDDTDDFFSSSPAKVDVGIVAHANPYEIRLIVFEQPE